MLTVCCNPFLYFSGDDSVTLAGGRTKFVTEVSVDNTGFSVWSGPATFKASCQLRIANWPFDNQTCKLAFGSYTHGVGRMDIKLFKDRSGALTSKCIAKFKTVLSQFLSSLVSQSVSHSVSQTANRLLSCFVRE